MFGNFLFCGAVTSSFQSEQLLLKKDWLVTHFSQGLRCKTKPQSEYVFTSIAPRLHPCMQWLATSYWYYVLLLKVKFDRPYCWQRWRKSVKMEEKSVNAPQCLITMNVNRCYLIDGIAAELPSRNTKHLLFALNALRGLISSISCLFPFLLQCCFRLRVKTQLEVSVPPPCSTMSVPPRSWGVRGGRSARFTSESVPIYSLQVCSP